MPYCVCRCASVKKMCVLLCVSVKKYLKKYSIKQLHSFCGSPPSDTVKESLDLKKKSP